MFNSKLLIICLTLLLSACSTIGPTIKTHSLAPEELDHFKTFAYFKPLDTDQRYESLLSQALKKQTTIEMTHRGFKLVDNNPDILINFSKTLEDKQEVLQQPVTRYNYLGRGYYDIWTDWQPYNSDFQQGTITIDLVDRKLNKVIWQGVAINRITDSTTNELQTKIPKLVSDIFSQFPLTQ